MSDNKSEDSKDGDDILVPAEQMNDFFFMNEEEEKEKYG